MLPESSLQQLQTRIRGAVLCPGDDGYDSARRVFNAMIDRRPALIARCSGAADVVAGVSFAREHDLAVSVRGGGHSVAGKAVCDGGLMIDLTPMKGIRVDPERRVAVAQPGLTLGDFDRETQAFGLATTLGVVSTTGIAGLTLGGGLGWLLGKHGLACDNLIAADVVTADARLIHATANQNSDLFWALRGGSGNFGVVTSLEYRLHPVGPTLVAGGVLFPRAQAREVLRFFRDFAAACPDELSVQAGTLCLPDGTPVVAIGACYCGPVSDGAKAVRALHTVASPVLDLLEERTYVSHQSLFDAFFPPGHQHYWKANFMPRLTDEAIDVFIECANSAPSTETFVWLEHLHGAAARVAVGDTAFAHRNQPFNFTMFTSWSSPADSETNISWTRHWFDAMRPYMSAGAYVNYLEDEADPQARAAYGPNYDRLSEVKRRYDPANFFRLNWNIRPAAAVQERASA